MHWMSWEPLYEPIFFMFFCIQSYIGTQGDVGWVVYSADRSKAVVPVLVLLFFAVI